MPTFEQLRNALLVAGGAVAAVLLLRPGDAYAAAAWPARRSPGTTGARNPPGPEYEVKHLPADWSGRRCDFVKYMRGLLVGEGLTGPVADLFVAHVARETGWGRAIWNHNFGNIKQFGAGPWHRLSDGQPYVTYPSARAGIHDNVTFLRDRNNGRYRAAWAKLVGGDPTWYGTMGRLGYYEGDPDAGQLQYDAILQLVRAC